MIMLQGPTDYWDILNILQLILDSRNEYLDYVTGSCLESIQEEQGLEKDAT